MSEVQEQYDDIDTIRRRNMRLLVEQHGLDEVCKKLGILKQQMRHWIGAKPIRNISRDIARKCERLFKRPRNWMDNPHDEETSFVDGTLNLPPTEQARLIRDRLLELEARAASYQAYQTSQTDRFSAIDSLTDRIAQIESKLTALEIELKGEQTKKTNNPHSKSI